MNATALHKMIRENTSSSAAWKLKRQIAAILVVIQELVEPEIPLLTAETQHTRARACVDSPAPAVVACYPSGDIRLRRR